MHASAQCGTICRRPPRRNPRNTWIALPGSLLATPPSGRVCRSLPCPCSGRGRGGPRLPGRVCRTICGQQKLCRVACWCQVVLQNDPSSRCMSLCRKIGPTLTRLASLLLSANPSCTHHTYTQPATASTLYTASPNPYTHAPCTHATSPEQCTPRLESRSAADEYTRHGEADTKPATQHN